MPEPHISVIVTAYSRRWYLPEALHSLENQSLGKDKFEVIVVKNFEDPRSDEIIRRNGWKWVYSNEEAQGRFVAAGLDEANGDVITFLEDDDMYAPGRLALTHLAFSRLRNLLWLHTLQLNIDEGGRPVHVIEHPQPRFDVLLRSDDPRWLPLLANYGGLTHNVSSIAVARHVAENATKTAKGLSLDLALSVEAGMLDGLMYHMARPLTYYRVYRGSASHSGDRRSRLMHRLTFVSLAARHRAECEASDRPFCYVLAASLAFHAPDSALTNELHFYRRSLVLAALSMAPVGPLRVKMRNFARPLRPLLLAARGLLHSRN